MKMVTATSSTEASIGTEVSKASSSFIVSGATACSSGSMACTARLMSIGLALDSGTRPTAIALLPRKRKEVSVWSGPITACPTSFRRML